MESLPLIPKSNIIPNLDVTSLIREVFQNELESDVPSKKLSENLRKSLSYNSAAQDQFQIINRSNLISYAENVYEAYKRHEESLQELTEAELNILQTHAKCIKREQVIQSNDAILDLFKLKRHPVLADFDKKFLKKFSLVQGDIGLPPKYEAKLDFRVKDYKKWKKRLESISQDSLINGFLKRTPSKLPPITLTKCREIRKEVIPAKKVKKERPKHSKRDKKPENAEIFISEPKIVFFTGFKPGEIYETKILVKNVSPLPVKFNLKPMLRGDIFKVNFYGTETSRVLPGLTFQLKVEFHPESLEDIIDDIILNLADGSEIKIPLIAYLEPPLLKTDAELDENTKSISAKIESSYIECGNCFAGDSKVVQIRFYSYGGSGEFCIMSSEDWRTKNLISISVENILEIPPYRVFPAYFEMREDESIDLNVEFKPETSGTHIDYIIIACNNGEIRALDLLGDGIAWHRYYFTIQDSLLKDFPVDTDDDFKVKYYLNLKDTLPTGKLHEVFCISNNSNMGFDFRWEMRDADIIPPGQDKYLKLKRTDVTVEPSTGFFEPNSIREFTASITFTDADIGHYRGILSLYVVNIPHQAIEEADTVIRPAMHKTHFNSQIYEEEEDGALLSPDLSMQGTYECLRESIRSCGESQVDSTVEKCITHRPLAMAHSLKKSKTYISLGESFGEDSSWCCLSKSKESTQYDEYGCPIPMFDTDFCGIIHTKSQKVNPENEHLWDYVDILVDEIELWAEVTPIRVAIEPQLVQYCQPLKLDETSQAQQVVVTNYNRTPIICEWSKNLPDKFSKRSSETDSNHLRNSIGTRSTNDSENYEYAQISEYNSVKEFPMEEAQGQSQNCCEIIMIPQNKFTIPAGSEFTCEVKIKGTQPGPIDDVIYLLVNDGCLEIELPVKAEVAEKEFSVSPSVLDFEILKTGTRYKKNYIITNDSSQEVFWRIKEYKFDFQEGKLQECVYPTDDKHIKNERGVLCHKGSFYTEAYEIQGKKPYLHCTLLKIQSASSSLVKSHDHFILVTADIKSPALSIIAPRFENAILAPPGMMYVGEKITKSVFLKNLRKVQTEFYWGHPFGCHCRKLKIEIDPKKDCISGLEKKEIKIDITPLEEGITDHCYVPCFVNKNKEPIILSIVGIAQNLNVTFEIVEDGRDSLTGLRIPWPIKTCDINLGLTFLPEKDVLEMNCKCQELEEELLRCEQLKDLPLIEVIDEAKEGEEAGEGDISETEAPLMKKEIFQKPQQSSKCLYTLEEEEEVAGEEDPNLKNIVCEVPSIERKLDFTPDSIVEYPLRDPSINFMNLIKSEIEFLNVPCGTAVRRQFVIRNETPINTKFSISIKYFGQYVDVKKNFLMDIKQKIIDPKYENDMNWQEKLLNDQPLLITASPNEGLLNGHDAVCVNIWAYGDTWGEYRDFALCQINGIKDFYLKIFVQIVGHPVYFPMFKNCLLDVPVLRFDNVKYKSEPVSRKIRVGNRSSIPISITWMTFLSQPSEAPEDREDPFNICIDMFTNRESAEESSESTKVYIMKNTAERAPSFMTSPNLTDTQLSGVTDTSDQQIKDSPSEKEKAISFSDIISNVPSKTKTELQLLANYGRFDLTVFQVHPKEMDLKPHGEEKLTITFNPNIYKQREPLQDFKATLTGCVRVSKEYETYCDIYFRHCGKNYVSQLLQFTATVEIPMLLLDIKKEKLIFKINANDVIKNPKKKFIVTRTFLITNASQSMAKLKIIPQPGDNFFIRRVNTLKKFFIDYDPDYHVLEIEPGQAFEMELECCVTYDDVLRAYEILQPETRIKRSREILSHVSLAPEDISYPEQLKLSDEKERKLFEEVYKQSSMRLSRPQDSLMFISQTKCTSTRHFTGTVEELKRGESSRPGIIPDENLPYKMAVFTEEICFKQKGLIEQALTAKLQLYFPKIKASTSLMDFGGVFVNSTAVNYVTLMNTSGFSTVFTIRKKRTDLPSFNVTPSSGILPHTNTEIGLTITVEFTPSQPGLHQNTFYIFSNPEMKFDWVELTVLGVGTWDENDKIF